MGCPSQRLLAEEEKMCAESFVQTCFWVTSSFHWQQASLPGQAPSNMKQHACLACMDWDGKGLSRLLVLVTLCCRWEGNGHAAVTAP